MGYEPDPEDMLKYPHEPGLYGIGHSLRLLYDTQDRGGFYGHVAHLLLQLSQIPPKTAEPSTIARAGTGIAVPPGRV